MEELKKANVDSKFRFILLAARRAEQVMRGARPKIPYNTPKVARGAMNEILAGVIDWSLEPPPPLPAEAEGADAAPAEAGESGATG